MSEPYGSEWAFVQLLLGLDTALAGALIYGQEHLLRVQSSGWILAASVFFLVLSLLFSLQCARVRVMLDPYREEEVRLQSVNPSYSHEYHRPETHRFLMKQEGKFRSALKAAIFLFGAGMAAAFLFFSWNLFGRNVATIPSSGLPTLITRASTMAATPCDPLRQGWRFEAWASRPWYLLLCALLAIGLRLLHSAWRAFAVERGDFPGANSKNTKKWAEAFKLCVGGFNEFKEHSDLFIPTLIGFFELMAYPVLITLGQYTLIGGWILIKTAGSWSGYRESRTSFNRFLLFNVFTLLLAYWLTRYIQRLPCS